MYLFIYLFLFLNFIFRTCSKSCKIITKHCNICISNMKSCSVLAKARDYIVFNSLYSHFWVSSYLYEQIGYFAIAVNNCFFLFFLYLLDVSFFQFLFEFLKYFISNSTGKYCSSIALYITCFILIHFPISLMHFCGWPFHYVTWRQMKRYIPHSLMLVPIFHLIQCTIHRRKINLKKSANKTD